MNNQPPPMCVICCLPATETRLIRLNWDAPNSMTPRIVVSNQVRLNDALVCERCVRDIKRIPFSDLHDALTAS
jgi:hypothetical protein